MLSKPQPLPNQPPQTQRLPKRGEYTVLDGAFGFSLTILAVMVITLTVGIINMSSANMWYNVVSMGVFQLSFVFIWYNYGRQKRIRLASATHLNRPTVFGLIFAVLAALACFAAGVGLEAFLIWFFSLIGYPLTEIELSIGQVVLFGIITIGLAPIGEELIFRGMVLRSLIKRPVLAILLSGALFAIFHMSPEQTVYQFGLGCALAVVAIKTNSVYTAMLCHFVSNALAFAKMMVSGTAFGYVAVAVGVVALIAAALLLVFRKNAIFAVANWQNAPQSKAQEDVQSQSQEDVQPQEDAQSKPQEVPQSKSQEDVQVQEDVQLQDVSQVWQAKGSGLNPVRHIIVLVYLVGIGVCLLTWITSLIYGLAQG